MDLEKRTNDIFNESSDHLAEFYPYLEDLNIPEDQRREFLETLWSIMVQFVSLGFGVDTASQAISAKLFEDRLPVSEPQRVLLASSFDAAHREGKTILDQEVTSI